jgi:hypothetical protein
MLSNKTRFLRPFKTFTLLLPPNESVNQFHFPTACQFRQTQQEQKNENFALVEQFFVKIVGAVPRQILIRKLLLLLFPKGINSISIRKMRRNTLKVLLGLIENNLNLIQIHFTKEIQDQWISICFNKLSNNQRRQKSDFTILQFTSEYLLSNHQISQSVLPSFADL